MTGTQAPIQPYAVGGRAVREHAEVERLRTMLDEVNELCGERGESGVLIDSHRIEMLRLMEEVKGALAAAQARITVQFELSQLQQQDDAGVSRRSRSPIPAP